MWRWAPNCISSATTVVPSSSPSTTPVVSQPETPTGFLSPSPSTPEGSLIKEQNVEEVSRSIYTIKVGGGGNLNLTKSPENASKRNAEPRYSSDGEKIAYIGPQERHLPTRHALGSGVPRPIRDAAITGVSFKT